MSHEVSIKKTPVKSTQHFKVCVGPYYLLTVKNKLKKTLKGHHESKLSIVSFFRDLPYSSLSAKALNTSALSVCSTS